MGTVFSFDIRDPDTPALRAALREAVAMLHRVDELFSPYKPDSVISRLARRDITRAELPPVVHQVLDLCAEAHRRTRGCFTDHPGGHLDPSGLVKGWATELASTLLYASGAVNASVNGGGDVQVRGEAASGRPWHVGIADPHDPARILTMVTGRNMAVATSGTSERGSHIIDPRTGAPVPGLVSATVTGPHLLWADVYATAAVILGPEAEHWLAGIDGYELVALVTDEGRLFPA
ncbi:MAG: FAD:protein FMN transferase [Streptomycetaceae bacterium]|nr:FAD:protein FMN transferase [Streptomycetaceae bacterium]